MNLTNKHIVLIIIAIIIVAFIYNYDVYIVQKYEPICKPIYVTKKILNTDEENLLNNNDPEGVATRLLIADAPKVQSALGMLQRYRSDSDSDSNSSSRGGKNKKSTKRRKQYRHKTQKR